MRSGGPPSLPGHRFGAVSVTFQTACECGWQSRSHTGKGGKVAAYGEWRKHIAKHRKAGA